MMFAMSTFRKPSLSFIDFPARKIITAECSVNMAIRASLPGRRNLLSFAVEPCWIPCAQTR
jgi:hypothetical protein